MKERKDVGRLTLNELENPRAMEKPEEGRFKQYFVRLFGKYDFRNEKDFLRFARWLILILLLLMEVLILWGNGIDLLEAKDVWGMVGLSTCVAVLTVSFSLQLFSNRDGKIRIVLYGLDGLSVYGMLFLVSGTLPLLVFIIVLTGFYINSGKLRISLAVFGISMSIYGMVYSLQLLMRAPQKIEFFGIFLDAFGVTLALAVHFVVVHIALAFYHQFLRLNKALRELDDSKAELEKAYAVVAEVTALEERQRIAKDIHDTAGHSITTVIMQTEAAKRIIESNPDEAKNKIIAANLQAKHALEELRDSVHILSGSTKNQTLKTALLGIIHESTDGTGIKIRWEIEDVIVSEAKYRFLCNTLKEGISNGLRHGGATAFWFELKTEGKEIFFLLSDNGTGFEGEIKTGFGLTSMRDRARALGGDVRFSGEKDEGFEIQLTIPTDGGEEI